MRGRREKADRREPLSKERVLRAAIGLADRGGIESLSMRKLAQELGVEAMSLYYYVSNKDDLIDGIVDTVVAEMEPPAKGGDWKASIKRSALSAHDVLRAHRWACAEVMSPKRKLPARLRYMDALLGRLREAGFSAEMTDHAYHALDSHIVGFSLWQSALAGRGLTKKQLEDMAQRFLRELPAGTYPHLAEHADQHLKGVSRGGRGAFEFGLDLILDGIERYRVRATAPKRTR